MLGLFGLHQTSATMRFKAVWELEGTQRDAGGPGTVCSSLTRGHGDIDTPLTSKRNLTQDPAKTSQ